MSRTEQRNPKTMNFANESTTTMLKIINEENMNSVNAVEAAIPEIAKAVDAVADALSKGGRLICVGTTSCRTIESVAEENGHIPAMSGDTGIFIYPGYKFKAVDALITNFHLPESTLLMLVSALYDREHIMEAYHTAVEEKYRFFSFGDAMCIEYA